MESSYPARQIAGAKRVLAHNLNLPQAAKEEHGFVSWPEPDLRLRISIPSYFLSAATTWYRVTQARARYDGGRVRHGVQIPIAAKSKPDKGSRRRARLGRSGPCRGQCFGTRRRREGEFPARIRRSKDGKFENCTNQRTYAELQHRDELWEF